MTDSSMTAHPDMREALAEFTDYFVRNYPGPHTIISDPNWHAPKIFRAAQRALSADHAATVDALRAKLARVEALAELWEQEASDPAFPSEEMRGIVLTEDRMRIAHSSQLRAALKDTTP